MARFDVRRSRKSGNLLLEVQADAHRQFDTCVVVPLLPVGETMPDSVPRLHPSFSIDGIEMRMATQLIGATLRSDLGAAITSLEDQSYEIVSALDVLLSGV